MVHLGERRVDDLRRHEVGEDLFHPHVVEPLHRHQIAEPHVRGLVRDDRRRGRDTGSASPTLRAACPARCRESCPRVPCRRTGTPESARNRTCRTRTECRCSAPCIRCARAWRSKIASLLRATLAASVSRWIHAEPAAVAFRGFDLEVAGDERKEVGRRAALFRRNAPSRGRAAIRRDRCSAPLAATCHLSGASSVSVQRALRLG